MTAHTKKLENLIEVAHEASSDKRRELLEGVTDLFMDDGPGLNDQEQVIASDILGKVITEVEREVRARLSYRLADLDNAPVDLIRQLASDEIEVARPLLERSGALSDQDLIEIINTQGKEHQLTVSLRSSVSEGVTDALVATGDDEVMLSVINNAGAEISRGAMETIVDRSETSEMLHEPLLNRQDLPPDLMHNMFWWVSAALKKHILTEAHVDEAAVDQMLAEAEQGMVQEAEEEEDRLGRVERAVRRRMRLGQLNQDALVQYLRRGQVPEFIASLGYLTDIDQKTARRIVFTPGHEAVAVACRAKGFDLSTFSTIVLLLDGAIDSGKEGVEKQLRRPEEVANLLELYKEVPVETAKRAMRFWAIRQKSQDEDEDAA
ncbi:MAG: DUF2336 domain-containing protein [Rhodospirillaceae bacterium]|jgi:uncharacterized protein (DUF2336 family)|nr:DUF2336 domain-containing protein [Rhodospirillaceae bacterium]MBT3492799.1 DUF2336 domain-containing protein [Rhodospirillaceae bacterium]MBT3779506.1 DUF2336 domain-containing protein [Rhodospirillaceae bacterium]MBT3977931.1 DUF2336 domain-containing protein [Rhodospirillaceae bacterium]MBT4166705.1 DUF2336 domain-containing protein [Rhodospirillaceae bacterium]